jgi:hypothetical protein
MCLDGERVSTIGQRRRVELVAVAVEHVGGYVLRPLHDAVDQEVDFVDGRAARSGRPGQRTGERGAVGDAGRDGE